MMGADILLLAVGALLTLMIVHYCLEMGLKAREVREMIFVRQVTFRGRGSLMSIEYGMEAKYYPSNDSPSFDGELVFVFDRPVDPFSIHAVFLSDREVVCDNMDVRVTVVGRP